MDYSNVTSEDLQIQLNALAERQIELGWEREGITKEMDDIHTELAHHNLGTTDDSAAWRELAVQ